MQLFIKGDTNTRFFHNLVKQRKKRLSIKRMLRSDGSWAKGTNFMNEAIQFYKDQFTERIHDTIFSLVDLVLSLIKEEDNKLLNREPTNEETKRVVFALNGNSASGPDGLTGHFYQVC